MRRLALMAVLFAGSVSAGPVPKPPQKAASLDGTWEVVERHVNGKRDDPHAPLRWTIDGESVVISMRGKSGPRPVEGTTFRLVKPVGGRADQIDYVLKHTDSREGPPVTFPGVFVLDGDELKLSTPHSADGVRPTACQAAKGTDLLVFKRVKDDAGK